MFSSMAHLYGDYTLLNTKDTKGHQEKPLCDFVTFVVKNVPSRGPHPRGGTQTPLSRRRGVGGEASR